ncbi:hypothetical protein [Streptomyces griseocarneus]|uniref:hypothetical protein n=1 Tax=Streptomyces griseocarneus TaxID=51201 RepID=UPI00167CE4B1|nr:hypothetical protein [Streptomyces griseocarneus]MBZ6476864.1 hypothetical protein [Streptomyces griseocarneus]GHG80995.1 hypothetical protein GCM10018779_62860 [Streptomyces griseocarneus]
MTQQADPHVIPDDAADAASAECCAKSKRAPHGDGFGAAFCASMAALCAEAVIGGTAGVLVMLSREHDDIPGNVLLLIAIALGVLLLTVLASGFVTAAVVMPALALARRFARGRGGTVGLWWNAGAVPVVSAATVAVFGAVAALGSHSLARPLTYLLWWGVLTAVLLPAALAGRAAVRRVREDRSGSVARRVMRDGLLAWLAVGALGAGAYGTGLVSVYEPPRLASSDLAGVWTDGRGGTVRLASGGNAVAEGLDNFVWDGTGKDRPTDCYGSGTWKPVKADGRVQGVSLRIGACDLTRQWSVTGTQKGPRIYHEVGKPGSGKRYVLTKVVRHPK